IAISEAIATWAYFACRSDVRYTEGPIDFRDPAAPHPALTKRYGKYHWQQEHRMLWAPRLPSPPLEPWIIQVPAARQFCRPVALPIAIGLRSPGDTGAVGCVTLIDRPGLGCARPR